MDGCWPTRNRAPGPSARRRTRPQRVGGASDGLESSTGRRQDPWSTSFPALVTPGAERPSAAALLFIPVAAARPVLEKWPLLAGPETEIWAMQLPRFGRAASGAACGALAVVEWEWRRTRSWNLDRPSFLRIRQHSLLALDAAGSGDWRAFQFDPAFICSSRRLGQEPQDVAAGWRLGVVRSSRGRPLRSPGLRTPARRTTRQAGPPQSFRGTVLPVQTALDCPVSTFANGDDRFGRETVGLAGAAAGTERLPLGADAWPAGRAVAEPGGSLESRGGTSRALGELDIIPGRNSALRRGDWTPPLVKLLGRDGGP